MNITTTPTESVLAASPMNVLDQAIERNAQSLQISKEELLLWLDQQMAPLHTQLQLLRLAEKHQLDPLSNEVAIFQNDDATQVAYITIDGWSKLINQHPQYAGMSLRESSELTNEIPNWMECTIYRNDRILPIVIKEYFQEVSTNHASWYRMPRRMLRHRVIQQCARLALGISANELFPRVGNPTINSSPEAHLSEMKPNKQTLDTPKSRACELKKIITNQQN
jgi:RecT family